MTSKNPIETGPNNRAPRGVINRRERDLRTGRTDIHAVIIRSPIHVGESLLDVLMQSNPIFFKHDQIRIKKKAYLGERKAQYTFLRLQFFLI